MIFTKLLLKLLWIVSQHSFKTFQINLVATFSIWWLNNDIVNSSVAAQLRCYEVIFNIWCLILFRFGKWNLLLISSFCSILKQNLNIAHLDLCRSDLDWVRLRFKETCCLVRIPNLCLPRRLFFSVKLFSKFGTSLINLRTYCGKLKFISVVILDKIGRAHVWTPVTL